MTYTIKNHMLYKDGKQVPYKRSPNQSGKLDPQGLTFHDTASGLNASGPISWLRNRRSKASAHLVIARDGEVTQLVPFNRKSWHAGSSKWKIGWRKLKGLNRYFIGAEIVNPGGLKRTNHLDAFKNWAGKIYRGMDYDIELVSSKNHRGYNYWMDYTPEQIKASTGIALALTDHYDFEEITTHWQISPGRKIDTNPLFPLDKIQGLVKGRTEENTTVIEKIKEKIKPSVGNYEVTARALNLRKYPFVTSRKIGLLLKGARLKVLHKGHSKAGPKWWKVSIFNKRGWVHSRFLKEVS